MKALVELPQRCDREVDDLGLERRAHATAARSQTYTMPAPVPTCARRRPGEHGDRVVLGCHRDPVVGLGEHRRLAGDRVAQHSEAVGRADRECVEAVEIVEATFERLLERRPLTESPREVAGSDLGVVLGLELDPLPPQCAAQRVVVRERAVVDEAQVEARRERVRALGRDPALGRHPRVAERVAAVQVRELERLRKHLGQPDVLVDLDHLTRAHHAEVVAGQTHPGLGLGGIPRDDDDGVARADGVDLPTDRRRDSPRSSAGCGGRVSLVEPSVTGSRSTATPALSSPRSLICASIATRSAPRRSSTAGDFANSPTIPHMLLLTCPFRDSTFFLPEPRRDWRSLSREQWAIHSPRCRTSGTLWGATLEARQVLAHLPCAPPCSWSEDHWSPLPRAGSSRRILVLPRATSATRRRRRAPAHRRHRAGSRAATHPRARGQLLVRGAVRFSSSARRHRAVRRLRRGRMPARPLLPDTGTHGRRRSILDPAQRRYPGVCVRCCSRTSPHRRPRRAARGRARLQALVRD